MSLKRFVYLLSGTGVKASEMGANLARYGVNVIRHDRIAIDNNDKEIRALLAGEKLDKEALGIHPTDRVRIMAVLTERSELRRKTSHKKLKYPDEVFHCFFDT